MSDGSNLKVALGETQGWARKLTITVPAQRVQTERSGLLDRYARRIQLPGFRKGRVPRSVVEKRFGASIDQEVVERVIGEAYREAIEQQGFEPISQGSIGNLDYQPGNDLTFDVEFEVRPELEMKNLSGFKVTAPSAEVGDDEVDKVIERLREDNATWTPVESGTPSAGDRVSVEITPLTAEESGDAPEPRPYDFVLGQDQAIPDVESAIQTLEPGADAEFEIEVPASDEEGAGDETEKQRVRIRLLTVERPELPETNDEFAGKVGPFETMAALRERVQADLAAEAKTESERQTRRALLDQVVAANPFDVPESMIHRYVESVFRLPKDADPERVKEITEAARPSAEQALRRMMAVEAIADANDLRATQDEVDDRVEEIARENERPVGEVWSSLQKSGRLQSLEDEITERKVFEFLKGQSTVENG